MNDNNNSKKKEQIVDANDVSRITAGTTITGNIVSQKDIRIDGNIVGNVFSEGKVVIGENALIKGPIVCSILDVWGKIEGEIFVKEVFSVKASADIHASIKVKKLQVELGALINGDCKMITDEEYEKAKSEIKTE